MATIEIDGAKIGYDEAGREPAVVLIHAGLADRRMWDHQFPALARDHRVIRYDWRGYGESTDASGEIAHHEDLVALMDALGVDRAARRIDLPDTGHLPPLERPQQVTDALSEFL